MSWNVSLTRGQRRALQALLAHSTVAEAAKAAGLCERTLFRYLAEPTFRDALQQEQDRLLSATRRRLATLTASAVEELGAALAVLGGQARATLADFVTVDGKGKWRLDLAKAEKAGLLQLARKLVRDKDGVEKLDLYSAQSAASRLGNLAVQILEQRRKAVELEELTERVADLERRLEGQDAPAAEPQDDADDAQEGDGEPTQ